MVQNLKLTIDTETGNIHADNPGQVDDLATALRTTAAGLWKWADELGAPVEEPEAYMYVNPMAEIEALRLDIITWYGECIKYNRPLMYHFYDYFRVRYIMGCDALELMELAAGIEVTEHPAVITYGDYWTDEDHEHARQLVAKHGARAVSVAVGEYKNGN